MRKKLPPLWLLFSGFLLAIALFWVVVTQWGISNTVGFALIIPIFIVAFFYPRRYAHALLGLLCGAAVMLAFSHDKRPWVSLETILPAALSVLVASEIVFRYARHRQTIETQLRASEERFRALAENAMDVIWTMDLNGHFTYISPAVEQVRGFTAQEVLTQTLDEALTHESIGVAMNGLKYIIANGHMDISQGPARYELDQPHKDGSIVHTEVVVSLLRDPLGQPYEILGITRDISIRKKEEIERTRSLALLTAVIESTSSGLLVLDRNENVIAFNQNLIHLWDLPKDWPGERTRDERFQCFIDQLSEPGDIAVTTENLFINLSIVYTDSLTLRNGTVLERHTAPFSVGDHIEGRLFTFFDITERTTVAQTEYQRRRQAEALQAASSALTASLDLERVLDVIIEQIHTAIPCDAAIVFWVDGPDLRVVRASGFDQIDPALVEPIQSFSMRINERPNLIKMFEMGQPMYFPDVLQEPSWVVDSPDQDYIRSWLGAPIIVNKKTIATFSLVKSTPNAFNEHHIEWLGIFASQAALAIENARLFAEVQRLAITDPLTELFNRRHLFQLAEVEFQRSRRYNSPLSVIMLDLDHFKHINDTYGHAAGDSALRCLARVCQENLRTVDILGRYGGEEFIILLPETPLDRARHTAERLRHAIEHAHFNHQDQTIRVTASLGVAEISDSIHHVEKLIDQADAALYRAKSTGRNRVSI